jgi:hypothetical protein
MVEFTFYGLIALTAMLVIAFCFACGDELPNTREKSSHDPIIDADLNDSRIIGTTTRSPRLGKKVRQYWQSAPAPPPQKTSAVEIVHGATYSDGVQYDRRSERAFNG